MKDSLETMTFPVISLFSGGGFLDLGFMNQGFQIEEAFELNEKFIVGYNFGLNEYFRNNATNLFVSKRLVAHQLIQASTDLSDIATQKAIKNRILGISGLIGGPPCQDYSIGGKNLGVEGDRGKLIYSYLNIVKMLGPEFLLFENVEGLIKTKTHRENFLALTKEIESLGYYTWYDVVNPLNYGFVQDRPRVIVVGFRKHIVNKLKEMGYVFSTDNQLLKKSDNDDFVFRWPKIKHDNPKAAFWPKKWEFGTSEINDYELSQIPKELSPLQVINAFKGLNDSVPNQTEFFTPKSDKFIKIDEGDTFRKSFKRLHRYRYSPTVAYGNNEVHLHPTEPRRLSVREALRLQTVPDTYALPRDMTLTAKFKMISNGVPPELAELIAKEIRKTLLKYHS